MTRPAILLLLLASMVGIASARDGSSSSKSSVYVPLDSWVYPALRRLAALGYISGQVADAAPWTRAECRRQTEEAAGREHFEQTYYVVRPGDLDARRLIADLETEFPEEERNSEIRLATIYTRALAIGGTPLRDSYHFGQTLANDYGRPVDSGFNNSTGFSAYAHTGRFSAYVRAEFQHAAGRNSYSPAVEQFIATADSNPVKSSAIANISRFQTLEMYAGAQVGPEYITFGKESLWWGPGEDSAFSFSNNAAPFYQLRFDQTKALVLPGFLRHLGKIHTQFLFGELAGHQWPASPYVNAQKITLDLTSNLEMGFTRSAFFGGAGRPLTWQSLWNSLASAESPNGGPYGAPDPGDRHSGFDFRWRLPKLRRYVTLFSDSYADDDPNPLDNPRRAAWGPGIYIAQLPKAKHMDLRLESYSTWLFRKDYGGNFIYWNGQYRDAYTNSGNLLGSWVGRDARALVGTVKYWVSGATFLQAQYKQIKTGEKFLPGGGTQTDVSVSAQFKFAQYWLIAAQLQGERYYVPILGQPRHDVTGSLQITFTPSNWRLGR